MKNMAPTTPGDTDDTAAQRQPDPALVEWGDVALAAKAAGDDLKPAWKTFIKARFFVPILRSPDDDPKNFLLYLARNPDSGQDALLISEVRERLGMLGDGTVALSGGDIVRRLDEQAGIDVALRDGVFPISAKRAAWLRSGIEVTKKRVVTRKILDDAAPAAPLPVLHVQTASTAAAVATAPLPVAEDAPLPGNKRYRWLMLGGVVSLGVAAAIVMATRKPEVPVAVGGTFEAALPPPAAPVAAPAVESAAPSMPARELVTFTAAYQSFTVKVPGLVEEVEQAPDQASRLRGVEMHQYRLQADGLMYTMEASLYRDAPPQAGIAGLGAAEEGVIGNGKLLQTSPVALAGAIGRETRVLLPSGAERAARYVFIGDKFLMVMVTVPAGMRAGPQVDAFLASFHPK
jgi:hypothetical protein